MGVPRTLAKGLSKLKEAAELRKLGGTQAERMARAAEQGYDTSRVFYHGSRSDITEFNPDLLGASTQAESAKKAFFFTDSPENASEYASRISVPLTESRLKANSLRKAWTEMEDFVQKKLIESNYSDEVWESVQPDRAAIENMRREERALMDSYLDEIDVGEGSTRSVAHGQSVYPVHLKMQNPFEYDFQGGDRVESFAALLDKARANGHDSAIFRNVRDPLHNNVHVVFEPNQIRSVNADFNPEYRDSPNLLAGIAGAMPYAGATAAALAGVTGSQEAEAGPLQSLGRAAPYLATGALGAAMMTPQDTQAYNDYIRDEMEARTAADKFAQMRGSKAGYWEARRQELLDMVSGLGEMANNVVLPALDKPRQGYLGLAGTLGTLASGGGFEQAIQAGARNATQPIDQTTYGYGGAVTDALSPYTTPEAAAAAGALVHGGIQIASPF